MLNAIQHNMSREEYLALEQQSDLKHEFYQGEIFAMSGGTFGNAVLTAPRFVRIKIGTRGHSRYQLYENQAPYFSTYTVINWLPLFTHDNRG